MSFVSLIQLTSMEGVLERHGIVDSEAIGGAAGEAPVVLIKPYKQNLLLSC